MLNVIKKIVVFNASHPYNIICQYPQESHGANNRSIFETKLMSPDDYNKYILKNTNNLHSPVLAVCNGEPILLIPSMFLSTEICLAIVLNVTKECAYDTFTSVESKLLMQVEKDSFNLSLQREIVHDKNIQQNLIKLIDKIYIGFYICFSNKHMYPKRDVITNSALAISDILDCNMICTDTITYETLKANYSFDRDVYSLLVLLSLIVFSRECKAPPHLSIENEMNNITIQLIAPLRSRSPLNDLSASCIELDECLTIAERLKMHFYSMPDNKGNLIVYFSPLRRDWSQLGFKAPSIFRYT